MILLYYGRRLYDALLLLLQAFYQSVSRKETKQIVWVGQF